MQEDSEQRSVKGKIWFRWKHSYSGVSAKTIISVSLLSLKVGAAAGWQEGSRMEMAARSFNMERTCKNHVKQLA